MDIDFKKVYKIIGLCIIRKFYQLIVVIERFLTMGIGSLFFRKWKQEKLKVNEYKEREWIK